MLVKLGVGIQGKDLLVSRDTRALHIGADELRDVIHGSARLENRGHAELFERVDILIGDDPAHQYEDVCTGSYVPSS